MSKWIGHEITSLQDLEPPQPPGTGRQTGRQTGACLMQIQVQDFVQTQASLPGVSPAGHGAKAASRGQTRRGRVVLLVSAGFQGSTPVRLSFPCAEGCCGEGFPTALWLSVLPQKCLQGREAPCHASPNTLAPDSPENRHGAPALVDFRARKEALGHPSACSSYAPLAQPSPLEPNPPAALRCLRIL